MKSNLRLCILDYPKLILDQQVVQKTFSDMLAIKQQNFARTSDTYISMGPLDMVSTHFLIYDQIDVYSPKVVAGFRLCFGNRTKHHKLKLPVEDYIAYTPREYQKKYEKFRAERPVIVDANAWFVDPEYTFSKTGMKLSEMIYFALVQFIVRKGYDHWVGATNEKFKASRWALPTGQTEDGMIFTHPLVTDPHKLLLFETLNYDWLAECSGQYSELIANRIEIVPEKYPQKEILLSVDEATKVIMSKAGGVKLIAA